MANRRILIVDDEEEVRMYLAIIIEELFPDFHILLAASPTDALYLLKKNGIDVVLLDVEMPGMTGLEMLTQLREQHDSIPIIFISGYKRAEFIQEALRLDAVDYVDKPVNPIELDVAIRKALLLKKQNIVNLSEPINQISNRIRLNTAKGIMFFDPNDILLFKSNKRDSSVLFKDGKTTLLIRENITSLSKTLPNLFFIHVNRQYIVNLNYVKGVIKCDKSISLSVDNQIIKPVFKDVLQNLTKKYSI